MTLDAPTVFLVDDDESVRQSMTWLLESSNYTVETFSSAADFLSQADPDRPGCLLLDIRMPGVNGLELQNELTQQNLDLPVIFITGHGDVSMCVQAFERGAFGFLEKPLNHEKLLDHIERAIAHDGRVRKSRASSADVASRIEKLTPREREVMDHLSVGKTIKQIAAELAISIQTCSKHRAHIWEKIGAQNDVELVRLLAAGAQQLPK
ncbi:MAG: response regulator [Pirellulales bacterium]|nr:response regulator [Pirellulales bacterium]